MDTLDAPASPGSAQPAASTGGYRKGEESRRRILTVALRAFGAAGYKGATTRRIADQARVNLPALKYYFGGKEGLYIACAREVVARYEGLLLGPLTSMVQELEAGAGPEAARARLKSVVGALIELQAGEHSDPGMAFALREMTEPGPAFDILFESFWGPGIDLVARLIGRVGGEAAKPEAARVQAILLLWSISAFSIARPVALRSLHWSDTRGARLACIRAVIEAEIDQIGRARAQ